MVNKKDHITDLFQKKFETFKVEPSPKIWSRLSFKLWFKEFITFDLGHFNAYYTAVTVGVVITTAILFVSLDKPDKPGVSENNTQKTESVQNSQTLNNLAGTERTQAFIRVKTDSLEKIIPIETKNFHTSALQLNIQNKITETVVTVAAVRAAEKNIENSQSNLYSSEQQTDTQPFIDSGVRRDKNLGFEQHANTENKVLFVQEPLPAKQHNDSILVSENIVFTAPVFTSVMNALPVFMTPLRAVIPVNNNVAFKKGENIVSSLTFPLDSTTQRKSKEWSPRNPVQRDIPTQFSVDVFTAGYISSPLIKSNSSEYNTYASQLKAKTGKKFLFNFGVSSNLRIRNVETQVGIMYNRMEESFSKNVIHQQINSVTDYEVVNNSYNDYDTVGWTTTGSDSTLVPILDSVWVELFDTNTFVRYDTIVDLLKNQVTNRISMIEIPITLGYEFCFDKITFTPRFGIITSILWNANGTTISPGDPNTFISYNKNDLPFVKTNFSLYLSTTFGYHVNSRIHFIAEPFYRRTIFSVFDKSYFISKHYSAYGLKFGLRYIF